MPKSKSTVACFPGTFLVRSVAGDVLSYVVCAKIGGKDRESSDTDLRFGCGAVAPPDTGSGDHKACAMHGRSAAGTSRQERADPTDRNVRACGLSRSRNGEISGRLGPFKRRPFLTWRVLAAPFRGRLRRRRRTAQDRLPHRVRGATRQPSPDGRCPLRLTSGSAPTAWE